MFLPCRRLAIFLHFSRNLVTSNVTGRHRGPKRKLRAGVACAAHLCKFISRHLRFTGYNFPFHVHILCIRYGTVLANTAVLCNKRVYVSFVGRYIVAPPGEWYYNTLLCCNAYLSSSSVLSRAFSALCVQAYSEYGHHPHPIGCVKFRFFRDLRC